MLLTQLHRWKHCALYSTFEEAASYVTSTLRRRILPRLEYFEHMLPGEGLRPVPGIRFFAPNLTRMDLNNIYIFNSETDAFKHLRTELKVVLCNGAEGLLPVLQQPSSTLTRLTLRSVAVYLPVDGSVPLIPPPPASPPHLHFLVLVDNHEYYASPYTSVSRIFGGTPALEDLLIWNADVVVRELMGGRLSLPSSVRTLHYAHFYRSTALYSRACPKRSRT